MTRRSRCRTAASLLLLLAVGMPVSADTPPAPRLGPERDLAGTWNGTYTCTQGLTSMTLTFASDGTGAWVGRLRFFEAPQNPGVPSGSFGISALYDKAENEFRVDPGLWIDRPHGYVTVSLAGEISPDGQTFAGEVLSEGCTTFLLKRLTS